jgi:PAS domain S-box-containing protein
MRIQFILANKHFKDIENTQLGVEVILAGEKHFIKSDRIQILNLLLFSYEAAIQKNNELIDAQNKLIQFNEQLEQTVESRTAALRESEGRYRLLLESVTDYVYTTTVRNGKPVATSHGSGCVAVTGYTSAEYDSDPGLWLRMVHEEDRPIVLEQASSVLAGKAPVSIEHRIIHKDGRVRWIRNTPVPRYMQDGRLIACDGIVTDMTSQKQAEEEIRKGKEEWERTFDAISDPIMILDTNHRIVKSNKAMADKLTMSPCETAGVTCYRVVHGTEEPPDFCPHAKLLTDRLPHSSELEEPRLGGNYFVSVSPLFDQAGELSGSVHFARDITEQKKLEAQLFHAQKMEAIGQLAGGIAHDFNNILTAIIGFATLLEMKLPKDDPLFVNVTQILAAADRAANLTRSMLAFSRKQSIEMKPVNLNEIVAGLEKMLRRLIREDIDLHVVLDRKTLTVLADVGQIEQVLLNLTTNARDSMPSGGTINITSQHSELDQTFRKAHGYGEPGEYALITFADTGEGMEESVRQRVFEPFFTTKELGKGTGLGLSVCYGIIKQHNGYIVCSSEPGRGTEFSIYLPLGRPSSVGESEPTIAPMVGGAETILLAEDDANVRNLTSSILSNFGYTVIEARDGEEAVAIFAEHSAEIQLCLFDLIMPKKNGGDAYEEIKKGCPDMRVLFMSGYQADVMKHDGPLDGAEIITKPVSPRELLYKVRETLEK